MLYWLKINYFKKGQYDVVVENITKCNVSGIIHEGLFNNYNINIIQKNNQDEISVYMNVIEGYKLTSVSL